MPSHKSTLSTGSVRTGKYFNRTVLYSRNTRMFLVKFSSCFEYSAWPPYGWCWRRWYPWWYWGRTIRNRPPPIQPKPLQERYAADDCSKRPWLPPRTNPRHSSFLGRPMPPLWNLAVDPSQSFDDDWWKSCDEPEGKTPSGPTKRT